MNETFKTLNDRIFSNPIYFIFGLSWFLIHWRFFVTTFLVSNESIVANYAVTKDVYLKHILFDTNHPWVSGIVVSLPFFVTWFVLYVVQPKLLPLLLRKHKEYEDKKNEIEREVIKEEMQTQRQKLNLEKVFEDKLKKEQQLEKIDPTRKWERDFQKFKKSGEFFLFRHFVKDVYSGEQNNNKQYISLVAKLDSFGAVETHSGNPSYVLGFTDVGKYFIQRLDDEE